MTSKALKQHAHTRSLIRDFVSRLEYSRSVKLLTEQHLEFLSLKRGYTCKMPHCWKSHVAAHNLKIIEPRHDTSNNVVCATSNGSDQPEHTRSQIRDFASSLNILGVLTWLSN